MHPQVQPYQGSNYTPSQRGHYHHGCQSGTYDEMSGYLGRWLSMTTAMGV